MAKEKLAVGIDYGTESGRVVVVRVRNGEELGSAVIPYPNGVIDERLPGGPPLEPDWHLPLSSATALTPKRISG